MRDGSDTFDIIEVVIDVDNKLERSVLFLTLVGRRLVFDCLFVVVVLALRRDLTGAAVLFLALIGLKCLCVVQNRYSPLDGKPAHELWILLLQS